MKKVLVCGLTLGLFIGMGIVLVLAEHAQITVVKESKAKEAELRQQLDDVNKQLDSCYEAADTFREDYFKCERDKGFEWKERMELMCSHFKEED
jgi:uncharacterized membrane-anchored protein YhcB (DUF1043 family)